MKSLIKAMGKNLGLYLLAAAVFFLSSGRFLVFRGLFYFAVVILGAVLNNCVLAKRNPEALAARADAGANTEIWDRLLIFWYLFTTVFIVNVVSGLDVRFGWSHLPHSFIVAGFLLYMGALSLSTWAMAVNKYFEGTVRIQHDRDHTVIKEGPYRYVRHPGNVAMLLAAYAQPLIVGSSYAFLPALLVVVLVVLRTKAEDRLLHRELPGYGDYAAQVRYRLIPRVW